MILNSLMLTRVALVRGFLASLIGGMIFTIFIVSRVYLLNSDTFEIDSYTIGAFALLFFGSIGLSFIPAILGSFWIANEISTLDKKLSKNNLLVFSVGGKVGAIVGFAICMIIVFTYLYRTDLLVIIVNTFIATAISILMAGLTALQIRNDINKNMISYE